MKILWFVLFRWQRFHPGYPHDILIIRIYEKNNRITRDSYSKKREIDKKKFIKKYLPTNDTNIISQFDDFIDYNCYPIIHNIDKIKKSSNDFINYNYLPI